MQSIVMQQMVSMQQKIQLYIYLIYMIGECDHCGYDMYFRIICKDFISK